MICVERNFNENEITSRYFIQFKSNFPDTFKHSIFEQAGIFLRNTHLVIELPPKLQL